MWGCCECCGCCDVCGGWLLVICLVLFVSYWRNCVFEKVRVEVKECFGLEVG